PQSNPPKEPERPLRLSTGTQVNPPKESERPSKLSTGTQVNPPKEPERPLRLSIGKPTQKATKESTKESATLTRHSLDWNEGKIPEFSSNEDPFEVLFKPHAAFCSLMTTRCSQIKV